ISFMRSIVLNRRLFLRRSLMAAVTTPIVAGLDPFGAFASGAPKRISTQGAKVAIVPCRAYGAAVRPALDKCFDLLGGIGSLVKDKTVTVKLNLTGTDFRPFLDRPVGETYMTHFDTALALAAALFKAG